MLRNGLGGVGSAGWDLDGVLRSLAILIGESARCDALLRLSIARRDPSRTVEPVEVVGACSSTVPALSSRSKDGEEECPAGVGIALTLASVGKALELGGVAKASWEGTAADSASVIAEEVGTAALNSVGVTAVDDGHALVGSGEDGESGEERSELHIGGVIVEAGGLAECEVLRLGQKPSSLYRKKNRP